MVKHMPVEARSKAQRGDLGRLVGLPQAMQWESPSSWVSRAALSQGIRAKDLLEFMGLRDAAARRTDVDRLLTSERGRAAMRSAESLAEMPIACRVFANLPFLDPKGEVLLRDERGRARARFCPRCLSAQRVKHIELHWRFATWRWCPLHDCLMQDHCVRCCGALKLPIDMVRGGARGGGMASLSDCQHCGSKLTDAPAVSPGALMLTEFDRVRLSNGRALMAALYVGRVSIQGERWGTLQRFRPYIRRCTFWKQEELIIERDC